MIKETLTFFLAQQQQTLEHEESLGYNNESLGQLSIERQTEPTIKSEAERITRAAQILQVLYRIMSLVFIVMKIY